MESARYYTRQGKIVEPKDYGLSRVDIRHAMKHGWFPSVTGVTRQLDKRGLTDWQIKQAILSATTLPRIPGEPDDAWVDRVLTDKDAEGWAAAERGKQIHAAIALYFTRFILLPGDVEARAIKEIEHFYRSIGLNNPQHEKIIVNDRLGLAGTIDCYDQNEENRIITDYKTIATLVKYGGPREEWSYQLGGYCLLLSTDDRPPYLPDDQQYSIIIARDSGEIKVEEWPKDEIQRGIRIFALLLATWKERKKYWPESWQPKEE